MRPALASDGARLFALWTSAASRDAISARELFPDATTGPAYLVTEAETPFNDREPQAFPIAAHDGVAYAIAYEVNSPDSGTDILLRRFSETGAVVETVVVASSVEEERHPRSPRPRPAALGSSWLEYDPAAGRVRAMFRVHANAPDNAFCTTAGECGSQVCSANVCCPATGCVVTGSTVGRMVAPRASSPMEAMTAEKPRRAESLP